ncbi:FecR family protein [Chitinophaga qingshengii]|uniref:FecR domain-containing protein n=1 Tax=Chitinophaga qingshengii TaxID=1569794 RepID=A0ABR7TXR4_9BACT|nr:FecR family protein [Chitinophaga qingshengii]MBC9934244.1 FecR domain-containing protein [Chitinophaga qingshengii]
MSDTSFEALFKGYMNGTLNASEIHRFRQMAMERENKAVLSRLLEEAFSNPAYAESADYDPAEMAGEILQKARQQDAQLSMLPPMRKPPVFRPWFKYVAAAAIFGFLVAGTWKFAARHRHERILAAGKPVAPVPPGTVQPVLILGDGSRVSLDSVANGTIARQGNARIVKLSNGQVAYQPEAGNNATVLYNTMQTPHGCMFRLTLPDGSSVWLNAASSIRYPTAFAGDSRQVEVTGEAYFDIAKDERKPFTVTVNHVDIQVLGTAFNVKAYPEENGLRTTLVQGAVNVSSGAEKQLLRPGEQATISPGGSFHVSKPNLEEILSWKNGEFYFQDTNIQTIMREVARWYNIDVKYEGDMSKVSLSGIISRNKEITQLLKALELTKVVQFRIQGNVVFVTPGPQS